MFAVGRLLPALRARLHKACGWLAYRIGCRRLARGQFEGVLLHGGADFSAYIHLGRIAFDHGDYAAWRREFEHARRLDPVRFARLQHTIERATPRLAGTSFHHPAGDPDVFDDAHDRATWRTLRPQRPGPVGFEPLPESGIQESGVQQSGLSEPRLDALLPGAERPPVDGEPAKARHDDCSSTGERRRLLALGPIRAAELKRCDLDELARRLSS